MDPYGGFERRVCPGDSFGGGGGQRGENAVFVGGVVAVRGVPEILPLSDFKNFFGLLFPFGRATSHIISLNFSGVPKVWG